MALETGTYISDLVSTNPASSDNISQGDDHIRLLKSTIKATFPNITGAVTPTQADLNKLTSSGSPQFSTIELGAASDTTISRVSAGLIAVEGGNVPLENRANTFTANQVIEVTDNSNAALRVTQLGTGNALLVEDSTNPDNSPFVVDASGNVGVGTSNPAGWTAKFAAVGSVASGGQNYVAAFSDGVNSTLRIGQQSGITNLVTDTALALYSSNTERMRIDSSGNLMVGAASLPNFGASQTSGTWVQPSSDVAISRSGNCLALQRGATDGDVATFWRGTTQRGYIYVSSTGTTYGTLSDRRVKENVQPISDAISRLSLLKPSRMNIIGDTVSFDGFIADELQEVIPNAVTGTKDGVDSSGNPVYQGVDLSKVVPLLTAALQEALTKTDALETRIAALEAA